jgi:tRNA threonylcarbamoyladenosine biosynthesis protein TsaB
VDTTTAWGSVAVVDGDDILGEVRLRTSSGHSHSAMPAVAFLLEALGLAPSDVEGYAVASGPGSFTGLRIGIGTVQGLALASGRPCLGVSALDVLAERMRGAADCLVAMMDAYRDEVYAGVYDALGRLQGSWQAEVPQAVVAGLPEDAAFLGDGAIRYREEILRQRPRARFPARSLYLAGTLGRIAEPRLRGGEGGTAAELRPLYLRPPHIRPPGR